MAFWWRQQRIALPLFAVLAAIFATTDLDVAIARGLFFDTVQATWLGAGTWWANDLIHGGGRWLIRFVGIFVLAVWAGGCFDARFLPLRRASAYIAISMALTVGCIGLLKATSNIDCPWDLQGLGGQLPHIRLFADRPDTLSSARCFPAAHAGSGYALFAIYFAAYKYRPVARVALCAALSIGLMFGVAQQARGAHFVSHDIWSAFLAWTMSLSVYVFAFKCRVWGAPKSA